MRRQAFMGSDTLPMIDVHEAEKKGLVKAEKTVYTFLSDNCQKTFNKPHTRWQ